MGNSIHSVTLDEEKCKGCTNCIKKCPTEAIRVRKSKAMIISERCIDCGECIRVCPYHAKKALSDPLEAIRAFDYKVALPAPTLYGQFKDEIDVNKILTAIKKIGFDDVYEVAKAAEIVAEALKELMKKGNYPKPLISSSCPAVVRLIQVRFPSLIDHIVKLESPMEVAARMVKKYLAKDKKNIGVFFISPCPAKVTSVRLPLGQEKSYVDGVISIKDIHLSILNQAAKLDKVENLCTATGKGIAWANVEGESASADCKRVIAVDGIHHVINVLEEIENGNLKELEFVEAMACPGGCVGGPLTVENPYIAKTRIKNRVEQNENLFSVEAFCQNSGIDLSWTKTVISKPVMKLDDDFMKAMKKMEKLEQIHQSLPGLDCGSCGSPNCRALAEDIVRGDAAETDCVFKLREKIRELTVEMIKLEEMMPPALDKEMKEKSEKTSREVNS